MNESILLEALKEINGLCLDDTDGDKIEEIAKKVLEAIKKWEDSSGKLVPVWHHPNKGTIPVHKQDSSGKEEGFLNFIVEAKNDFIKKVIGQDSNTELRVDAENIIIAYDQMMNRLFDVGWVVQSVPPYKGGEDLEQEIERLKGLIEKAHQEGREFGISYQQFKTQNNL